MVWAWLGEQGYMFDEVRGIDISEVSISWDEWDDRRGRWKKVTATHADPRAALALAVDQLPMS